MLRLHGLVLLALPLLGSMAAAQAPKYPVPPHPPLGTNVCAAVFDAGSPTATWNAAQMAYTVTANGKYNYDNTWTFVKLEVYLRYINPTTGGIRNGPSYEVTDESTLATPGTFAVTFNNVAKPQVGEALDAFVRITVRKQGQIDKANSSTKEVIPAANPE